MSDVVNEIKNLHSKIEELIKFKKINEDIWNDDLGNIIIDQVNEQLKKLEYELWDLLINNNSFDIEDSLFEDLENDNRKLGEILNKSNNFLRNRGV